MKKNILPLMVIMMAFFTSCNDAQGPDVDTSIAPPKDSTQKDLSSNIQVNTPNTVITPNTVTPSNNVTPTSNGNIVMPMPSPNTGQQQIVMPQGQNIQKAPPTTTAPGMNPPHGQPGHRCDIAVGAPLNSPKAATQPAQVAPTTIKAPTNIAAPTTTAPGMNPPHGQPGHRCEIAVGAPLNSQPATVTQTGTTAPAAIPPAKNNGTKQDVLESKKLQEAANAEGKKELNDLKEAKEEKKN